MSSLDNLFEYTKKTLENANSNLKTLPMILLLDNSGSMASQNETLNSQLKKMISDLQNNRNQKCRVLLRIVSFNTDYEPLIGFTYVNDIDVDSLPKIQQTKLATYLGSALKKAVDELDAVKQEFKDRKDSNYYQPFLVVLTDGIPQHEDPKLTQTGIDIVKNKIREKKLLSLPILIGEKNQVFNNLDILNSISMKGETIVYTENDKDLNLSKMLQFVTATVDTIGGNALGNGDAAFDRMAESLEKKRKRELNKRNRLGNN